MPLLDNPLFVSILMFLYGIAVKYIPALKEWPNRLIVWGNLLIGILAKLVAPEPAHAGFFSDLGHSIGWTVVPLEAFLARGIYETFVRPTLEHFGIMGFPSHAVKKSELRQGELPK
jgi:hypothetical protein